MGVVDGPRCVVTRWRRLGRIAVPVLALIGLVHTGLWFWAMAVLQRQVEAFLMAPAAPGWRITAGKPQRGGWPLRILVEVPNLAVSDLAVSQSDSDNSGGIAWSAARLSVSVALLQPRRLVFDVTGPQALRLPDTPPIPISVARMHAEVPLDPGVPVRSLTVEVAGWRAVLPEGSFGLEQLDVKAEMRPAAPQGETALALTLAANGITLPPPALLAGATWPLGPAIAHLVLDAALSGPVPRGPHLVERAENWRDGGGALEVRRLELHWGELRLTGSATLALDERLQPMGAATARIAGHGATLDALAGAQLLTARSIFAAKAVLALLARPAPDGGAPTVEVPFSLQNSTLALGRIPLVRVPAVAWPPPP